MAKSIKGTQTEKNLLTSLILLAIILIYILN